MKTLRVLAIGALVLGVIVVVGWQCIRGAQTVFPFANLLATETSFDIGGGRKRIEEYFMGRKTRDIVEETPLSLMYRELLGPPPPPDWKYDTRTIGAFGFFDATGPYHGANSLATWMASTLESGAFTDAARREALDTVLALLGSERVSDAKVYEADIEILVEKREHAGNNAPIEVSDLPAAPAKVW